MIKILIVLTILILQCLLMIIVEIHSLIINRILNLHWRPIMKHLSECIKLI